MRIFSELLFLHGHIANVALARELAGESPTADEAASSPVGERPAERQRRARKRPHLRQYGGGYGISARTARALDGSPSTDRHRTERKAKL